MLLAMAGMANAATLFVTNTADSGSGSLRGQIAAASPGDTIEFSVTGTITLLSTLDISTGLTIAGPPGSPGITINGGGTVNAFFVSIGGVLSLENLTITDADTGIFNQGTLSVAYCTFFENDSSGDGGGIGNFGGTVMVNNTSFLGNDAFGGGGLANESGTAIVTDSTFSLNNGQGGGGIENFGILTVTNSTFSGNTAAGFGGGGIENQGTVKVTNSTFSGNSASTGAGGILNTGSASLKSTILASSTGGNCSGPSSPPVTDAGYNISDDATCDFTVAPSGTSINGSTTLHLDPAGLKNNGGPTDTIALEPNSQAVDFIPVADCTDQSTPTPLPVTTDQRGFPRPDPGNPNFCDAGAFELTTMPFAISDEALQIVRSSTLADDQINLAMTFTEFGFPTCDSGTDPFNGITVTFQAGTCAEEITQAIQFPLEPWTVHTIGDETYGTTFLTFAPGSLSARMVELPTPAAPACGEWNLNLEIAGTSNALLGDGPFSLLLTNGDGGEQCFDVTHAVVGNQTPPPARDVRRGVRR
jgi:hypothetical protein